MTVYPGALPVGTVLWSIPGNGSRVSGIYPAVPSSSGVADVFATEDDGTVLAVTADGEVAWTTNVGTDFWNFLPDFQGGLVVYNINNSTFYKLDGLTGQAYPAYQPSPVAWGHIGPPAIHTDGTIFTSDYTCTNADCSNSAGWLVGIDPSSGTSKFRAPTANSTGHVTSTSNDFDAFGNPWCGPLGSQTSIAAPLLTDPMVLGDGYAYTTYVTHDGSQTTSEAVQPFPVAAYDYFDRLRVDTNYSGSPTPCVTWQRWSNPPGRHLIHWYWHCRTAILRRRRRTNNTTWRGCGSSTCAMFRTRLLSDCIFSV